MSDTLGIADDEYDVHVTVRVAIRRTLTGRHAGLRDEIENVVDSLRVGVKEKMPESEYPRGTIRLLSWEGRVLDAKALRRAIRKAAKQSR